MAEMPESAASQPGAEALKARHRRNLWLGLALAGFVVLVTVATIIRLHGGIGVSERM